MVVWSSLFLLIISIGLFIFGFFSIFRTKKLVDFYLSIIMKKGSSNAYSEMFKRLTEKRWFYFNIKLCGILCILMGIVFLIFPLIDLLNKFRKSWQIYPKYLAKMRTASTASTILFLVFFWNDLAEYFEKRDLKVSRPWSWNNSGEPPLPNDEYRLWRLNTD